MTDEAPTLKTRPGTRDREAVEAWTNRKLDEIEDALHAWNDAQPRMTDEEGRELIESDELAILAAEHGDIEPLRAKYPRLARYLHLPKLDGPGRKFPAQKDNFAAHYEMSGGVKVDGQSLTLACWDVPIIRAIWKTHYKKFRLHNYHPPQEIAARRHDVKDPEHVYAFLESRRLISDIFREKRLEFARAKYLIDASKLARAK